MWSIVRWRLIWFLLLAVGFIIAINLADGSLAVWGIAILVVVFLWRLVRV